MKRGLGIRITLALGLSALGAASAPAGALAAGTGTGPVNAGRVVVQTTGLFNVHGDHVTVPQRPVVVSGTVQGFAPGQRVELTAKVAGRVFRRVPLTIARRGTHGHFQTTLRAPSAGRVSIELYHPRNDQMLSFERLTAFTALNNRVTPGATGRFIQLVQEQLAALHLYIPQTGVYDQGTELALDAYNRLLGRGEGHMTLDPVAVTDLLDLRGAFHVRYPSQGQHAEGDLSDQVLAFIQGSQVKLLFPISSGKPSTPTILGNYQVYRKQPGYLPDGMYYSSFFTGGYAIHGYDPAPDYPASHGCMRLPIVDAVYAYNWIQMGNWVDTYYT
jgi:L,D-transpeptidase catalytic domain